MNLYYNSYLIEEDQVQRYGNICVKNNILVFLKILVFLVV